MVHPGRGIFGSDFGTTSFVISKKYIAGYKGSYRRLFDKQGEVESIESRERAFLERKGCYTAEQSNFSKIPGSPIAYWVSKAFVDTFEKGMSVDGLSDFTGSQHITANNDKYLRFFWEVAHTDVGVKKHWAFYAKGGEFRKWYGNVQLLVDTSEAAMGYYVSCSTANCLADRYWFTEGITYSAVTSKGTGFRYYPAVGGFDKGGATICYVKNLQYILGLLNSKYADEVFKLLNPTINLQVKDVKSLPVIKSASAEEISNTVDICINMSKTDWDSFETSWDFKKHPLV